MRMTLREVCLPAALMLAGCGSQAPPTESKPAPAAATQAPTGEVSIRPDSAQLQQIKVAAVETAEVPLDVVTAPGRIELNPNRVSHVVLPLAGRIAAVMVKLGDTVKKGDPVILLESPDADVAMSAYLSAVAGVNTAKSALIKAQADYDRTRDLYEHQAVAQKEVLNAQAAVQQAKSAVEQAAAAREQAQRRLDLLGLKNNQFGQKITVPAPVSGKVLELTVAAGEYRNDMNAPLMTIADLSTVWVASDVPENQIRFIEMGERLDIELVAFPGKVFRGRVTRLADTVDPQTRTLKVRAEMDNRQGLLRPEMFGNIRHVDSTAVLPVIPTGAVVQSDGQNIVYLERSRGDFVPVKVRLGTQTDGRVAVTAGVKAGDRIVVDGVMLLKNS
ncbi:MAG: efflux RND transporter periplasmic adaptor subunit [Acidobacteria bacterium]|nr:efflux RND transporter periplasmic adaptor subunit [Acidobacteriota bacterium]